MDASCSVERLRDVAQDYDVFAFPIYGFVHDGFDVNPNVIDVLTALAKQKKTITFLTNVCRLRRTVIQQLATMGITPAMYQHVITAGEATYAYIQDYIRRADHKKKRFYICANDETLEVIEELSLNRVCHIEDADAVIVLGIDDWHDDLAYYQDLLAGAAQKQLPMICGNPDHSVYYRGEKRMRAGAVAACYKRMGGPVHTIGKPNREFYALLRADIAPLRQEKTLIIGDSICVDVKGAYQAGFDCLLAVNETTYSDLKVSPAERDGLSQSAMLERIAVHDLQPQYIMYNMKW